MENIVYVLGAGFSVPFGLPNMKNFLSNSKDILKNNKSDKYDYFEEIIYAINSIANIKNYINSNLFNIEETLSVLEMSYSISNKKEKINKLKEYVKDVIKVNTPSIEDINPTKMPSNWNEFLFGNSKLKAEINARNYINFGKNEAWNLYGLFLLYLLQLKIERTSNTNFEGVPLEYKNRRNYSIITLNYDEVIEILINFINNNFIKSPELKYTCNSNLESNKNTELKLSKLHGTVSSEIILPTWSKNISEYIKNNWQLATNLLSEANEIRIIGYSLPSSDNYIKYLLANAFINPSNIKNIDVITMDDGGVKERYENFFTFHNFRFKDANFLDFISKLYPPQKSQSPGRESTWIDFNSDILEQKYSEFMYQI